MEEELLKALIKRGVDHCFEDDMSKTIASDAIRKAASLTESVKSLEFLALKAAVAERRRVDPIPNVLFRLIFKEPLNVDDYGYSCSDSFFCCQTGTDCHKLRNDPYVMYAVVQKYAQRQDCVIDLVLTRTHLTIKYRLFNTIAMIPNRENKRYDTFWAIRFFQLCLKMRCHCVRLGIEEDKELWDADDDDYTGNKSLLNSSLISILPGNRRQNYMYKRRILKRVINSVNRVTPAEGWEQTIAKGELAVYEIYDGRAYDDEVLNQFYLVENGKTLLPDVYVYAFQI